MNIHNEEDMKELAKKIDSVLNDKKTGQDRQIGFALVLVEGAHLENVDQFSYVSSFTTPDSEMVGQALVDRARDKRIRSRN